jgi:DNA-directed RNA polymerase subunit F
VKKLATKLYNPSKGWNEETYEKHGKTLIANFLRIQKNHRTNGKLKLKKFLANLFKFQIEEVIKYAEKQTLFKAYKSSDPWSTSITRVFSLGDFSVAGNMQAIQSTAINGVYEDAKKLLGEEPTQRSRFQNKDRSYRIASKVTKINNTTRKLLKSEILKSLKDGLSVSETSKKLRDLIPQMNRRIPTIVRTEMSRATDEGVKQAMKESKVITHCSVMGCEKEEPLFTYNGQSTCNVENVPIGEVDGVEFHINHTGAWVPSKFKTQKQIAREARISAEREAQQDPTAFPSKPRRNSRDSRDAHTRNGIFNKSRTEEHKKIKNLITGNQTETSWKGEKSISLLGGGFLLGDSLRNKKEFKNNNPRGRVSESVYINPEYILEELPEYKPMQKASRMGSLEQNNAYLQKETSYIINDLINEITIIGLTAIIEGIHAGSRENYDRFYDNLKEQGHKLEGHFIASNLGYALNKNTNYAVRLGREVPKYFIERSIECTSEILTKVQKGVFNKFYLYDDNKTIFKFEDNRSEILDHVKFQDFVFNSRYYTYLALEGNDLPFLKNKHITKDITDIDQKDTTEEPDAKDLQIMSVEIITGVDKDDSQLQPFNEEYKLAWKKLETQIAEIEYVGNKLTFDRFIES